MGLSTFFQAEPLRLFFQSFFIFELPRPRSDTWQISSRMRMNSAGIVTSNDHCFGQFRFIQNFDLPKEIPTDLPTYLRTIGHTLLKRIVAT